MADYRPDDHRYDSIAYRRCGRSGILLPGISLGLWHNFGGVDTEENSRAMIHTAFDLGITHFDLANNYGPPPGSAEETFGRILAQDLQRYRDELIISSKAGYRMWPGPYGEWGSRKYLVASLDQSLRRMGLEYVDIFYSHRPDPDTPLEETMQALDQVVRQGKALYAGISSYTAEQTLEAVRILNDLGTPCLIHQPNYSMFNRWIEDGLLDVLEDHGIGCIAFCPLAQGMLTPKYLGGIPTNSRAGKSHGHLQVHEVTGKRVEQARLLQDLAQTRGQTLPQLALSWVLRDQRVTSALIGASRPEQITENIRALDQLAFTPEEINAIEQILAD
ncbi:MAG: L-glyceraldehyde 3-phosphate reductase [Verrucomicrobiota bacterium]|nr:L-glyceraldehyde 3-phosphate reductase [Verrucomicrobiota bacterium]